MTRPDPAPLAPGAAPRRRRWPIVLAVLAVAAFGVLGLLWNLVDAVNVIPVSITVEGERVVDDIDLAALPPAHKVVLVGVLAVAVLTALLAVPVALLMALLGLALAVLLPLALAVAALAVVTSPLWLLGWLAWRAAAGRRASSSTMAR